MRDPNEPLRQAQERVDALVGDALPGRGRAAPAVLVCALAFAATCWVVGHLRTLAPPGSRFEADSLARRKYDLYARHAADFDLVFVGTSHVYRQFDAGLFDEEMAARGYPTRSFNFGLGGMRHPEVRHVARRVLDRPAGRRPRWLFVELTGELVRDRNGWLHDDNPYTHRTIDWHTADVTALLGRAVLASDAPPGVKAEALWVHLRHFALRFANVGIAESSIRAWLESVPPPATEEPWNGYQAMDDDPELAHMRRHFTDRGFRAEHAARIEDLRTRPKAETPDPHLAASLRALVDAARSAGVEPVFVIAPPHWHDDVDAYRPDALHGLPALLSYADPDAFPGLYDVESLYNDRHLNKLAARDFTRRLAQDFGELLRERGLLE